MKKKPQKVKRDVKLLNPQKIKRPKGKGVGRDVRFDKAVKKHFGLSN